MDDRVSENILFVYIAFLSTELIKFQFPGIETLLFACNAVMFVLVVSLLYKNIFFLLSQHKDLTYAVNCFI